MELRKSSNPDCIVVYGLNEDEGMAELDRVTRNFREDNDVVIILGRVNSRVWEHGEKH